MRGEKIRGGFVQQRSITSFSRLKGAKGTFLSKNILAFWPVLFFAGANLLVKPAFSMAARGLSGSLGACFRPRFIGFLHVPFYLP